MCRVLAGSRKRVHPRGWRGDEPGCWEGSPGAGCASSFAHRAWSLRGSEGESWPGCSRGALGDVPSAPGAAFQCLSRRCPNPINSPLCFPHLKAFPSPRSRAGTAVQLPGSCSSARSCEDGFPSTLWFGVGALDGIWLFITLPDLRDLRRRFCRARCRSQMAEPGSEAALGLAPQAGGAEPSARRTCRTLIAASVPTLVLVLKV